MTKSIEKIEDFLSSSNIDYCAATVDGGDKFLLIQRTEVLRLLGYCKRHHFHAVSSLTTDRRPFVLGAQDYEFITGPGVRFDDLNCTVLFCNVSVDGRWFTRYWNAPISRIMPPSTPGGPFKDGVFLTPRSIAFKADGVELRTREHHESVAPTDIDVVYTWVDSDDPRWIVKKSIFSTGASFSSGDNPYRYLSRDELKYSIRSLERFAPWVRNIYIVTDEQTPNWLEKIDDKIKVIDHREIFPDHSVLPVFNSHAIESCLHRIEGLSEFFIYFNDDVFLGRAVEPSHFFDETGASLMYISQASFIDPSIPVGQQVPTDVAAYNMQGLIIRDYGFTPTRKMMHTPHPLRKSVMEEICIRYHDEVDATRRAKVRSKTDLAIPSMFYPYYAWATGRAILRESGSTSYRYFDTGKSDFKAAVAAISKQAPHFFCANVTYHEEVAADEQARLLEAMFKRLYPNKSRFEK
jgi:hypothetical protein